MLLLRANSYSSVDNAVEIIRLFSFDKFCKIVICFFVCIRKKARRLAASNVVVGAQAKNDLPALELALVCFICYRRRFLLKYKYNPSIRHIYRWLWKRMPVLRLSMIGVDNDSKKSTRNNGNRLISCFVCRFVSRNLRFCYVFISVRSMTPISSNTSIGATIERPALADSCG